MRYRLEKIMKEWEVLKELLAQRSINMPYKNMSSEGLNFKTDVVSGVEGDVGEDGEFQFSLH